MDGVWSPSMPNLFEIAEACLAVTDSDKKYQRTQTAGKPMGLMPSRKILPNQSASLVGVNRSDFASVKYVLLDNVKLAFDEQGISIPYPQMDVHTSKN